MENTKEKRILNLALLAWIYSNYFVSNVSLFRGRFWAILASYFIILAALSCTEISLRVKSIKVCAFLHGAVSLAIMLVDGVSQNETIVMLISVFVTLILMGTMAVILYNMSKIKEHRLTDPHTCKALRGIRNTMLSVMAGTLFCELYLIIRTDNENGQYLGFTCQIILMIIGTIQIYRLQKLLDYSGSYVRTDKKKVIPYTITWILCIIAVLIVRGTILN